MNILLCAATILFASFLDLIRYHVADWESSFKSPTDEAWHWVCGFWINGTSAEISEAAPWVSGCSAGNVAVKPRRPTKHDGIAFGPESPPHPFESDLVAEGGFEPPTKGL